MSEALQVIRWTFFFPLGIAVLFFALVRAPLEHIGEHTELVRKVFLVGLVLFAVRVYPTVMQTICNITTDYTPPPASEVDIGRLMEIKDAAGAADVRENLIPWTSDWFIVLLRCTLSDYTVFLMGYLLYIPQAIGRFISGVLINAAIKLAIVISPLMLPMITLKEARETGIKFIMTSMALTIAPVGVVLIDAFIRDEVMATMIVLLVPSLGGMVGSGAALSEVMAALAVKVGAATMGPQIFVLFGIVLSLVVGTLFILTTLYSISGFILMKIITSGSFITSVTGGFASANSAARNAAMPLIEGAEAARRTIKERTAKGDNHNSVKNEPPPQTSADNGQAPLPKTVNVKPPPVLT